MKTFENSTFSCRFDENDIDQDPSFIRADGDLVATTAYANTEGEAALLAKRITLALNHVRGLTIEEIRSLGRAKNEVCS